jgi:hypothetical protein
MFIYGAPAGLMFLVGVAFHLPVIGQQPPRLLPVGAEAPTMMFVLRI